MSHDALMRLQSALVDEISASHHFGQTPALPPELRRHRPGSGCRFSRA